jgi:hypothetical protein
VAGVEVAGAVGVDELELVPATFEVAERCFAVCGLACRAGRAAMTYGAGTAATCPLETAIVGASVEGEPLCDLLLEVEPIAKPAPRPTITATASATAGRRPPPRRDSLLG